MDPRTQRPLGRQGLKVPVLGLGTAALGNLFARVDEDEAHAVVAAALDAGLTFIDTAPYYGAGLSEHRVGEALRGRKRDSYVLSTKVGRLLDPLRGRSPRSFGFVDCLPFDPVYDYTRGGVMRSFEDSLQRLGVDRIDVLLMHDLGEVTHGKDAARHFAAARDGGGFRALEELRRSGAVSAIGLGVNEWEVCVQAMQCADLDCVLLAGRYTLLEQSPLDSFLPACADRRVSIILGGPYNSGLLATEPKEGATWNYAPAPPIVLERARRIWKVCEAHGVPAQAAALQFPLLHPCVATVIPGPRSVAELASNVDWFGRPVPAALWRDLAAQGLLHPKAPTG